MTDFANQPRPTAADVRPDGTRDEGNTELLLSRAVDGTLSDAQWASLEAKAQHDRALWRELCLLHRDDLAVRARVQQTTELTTTQQPLVLASHAEPSSTRAWMGWAAAAVLGLVAAISISQGGGPLGSGGAMLNQGPAGGTQAAGLGGFLNLDEALNAATPQQLLGRYVQSGREQGSVFGVMPERVVLHSTPLEDGKGYEVYFVRQIVERAHVPAFYRLGIDELGNAAQVPTSPTVPATPARPANPPRPPRTQHAAPGPA
jgi:hypothetical protein